jgi:hypothetical protein
MSDWNMMERREGRRTGCMDGVFDGFMRWYRISEILGE